MDIKAYDFFLNPHDQFSFYLLEGVATLVTDEKNPRPPQTTQRWNKSKRNFESVIKPTWVNSIIIPTWEVLKEDFDEHLSEQIPPLFESGMGIYDSGSIYILRKDWGDFWELGLAFYNGRGTLINEYATNLIEQYMKLKAFW